MILRGERGIHDYGGNMQDTIRLSECYSIAHGIDVQDDDSYYSKIELIATGKLTSEAWEYPGIQSRIYNAWKNSWNGKDFAGYPVDICLRISNTFEECCARVLSGENRKNAAVNVGGLSRLVERLDETTSKDFKIFAGYDERRWDFIASMKKDKAILYIKNSPEIEKIMSYLEPFLQVEMARYVIASEIEKKFKARKC